MFEDMKTEADKKETPELSSFSAFFALEGVLEVDTNGYKWISITTNWNSQSWQLQNGSPTIVKRFVVFIAVVLGYCVYATVKSISVILYISTFIAW